MLPPGAFSRDVEVLSSGTLAHSTGPVYDAAGRQFGTFNSVWRREKDGSWKVVMDKGCDVCNCDGPSAPPGSAPSTR